MQIPITHLTMCFWTFYSVVLVLDRSILILNLCEWPLESIGQLTCMEVGIPSSIMVENLSFDRCLHFHGPHESKELDIIFIIFK